MAVATFDTLKFANTLKSAGVPDKQAEAQAVAFAEIIQINFKDLATKDDLALLRSDVKHDTTEAVAELRREFIELRGEMKLLKWLFGAILGFMIAVSVRLFLLRGPLG
jgi:G3E family GTPase